MEVIMQEAVILDPAQLHAAPPNGKVQHQQGARLLRSRWDTPYQAHSRPLRAPHSSKDRMLLVFPVAELKG